MTFVKQPRPAQPDPVQLVIPFATAAASTTFDVYKVPAGRTLQITRVHTINPTGLVQSGTNFFVLNVLNVAAVAALFSTGVTALVAGVASADFALTNANLWVAGGAAVRLNLALTGATTLPAGTLIIEGRLL